MHNVLRDFNITKFFIVDFSVQSDNVNKYWFENQ